MKNKDFQTNKATANDSGAMEQIPFEKRGNRNATGRGNAKNMW